MWAIKWRSAHGERIRRRLGAKAWVVRDRGRGWRPREGRPAPGHLTEYQARRGVAALVDAVETERTISRAPAAEEAAREAFAGGPTFRSAFLPFVVEGGCKLPGVTLCAVAS